MPEKNNENPNSENGTGDATEVSIESLQEKLQEKESSNKQLYSRAKKAEGFELKDGEWTKKETPTKKKEETKKEDKSNEFGLVEKGYLKAAGISDVDEIDLAKKLMEETGQDLDKLIEGNYFKSELKDLQDAKATAKATSGVKGGTGGGSKATENPEYWIAKGVPPTKSDVPDRKVRVKIHKAMMKNSATGGKKFYND